MLKNRSGGLQCVTTATVICSVGVCSNVLAISLFFLRLSYLVTISPALELVFVTGLPLLNNHSLSPEIVVCFSKAVHFVPLPKLTSFLKVANLPVKNVF